MNTVTLGHKISQAGLEMKNLCFLGLSFAIQLTTLCRGIQQVAPRSRMIDYPLAMVDSCSWIKSMRLIVKKNWTIQVGLDLVLLQRETIADQLESVTTFSASTTLVSFRRRLTSSHGEIIFSWESDPKKKISFKSLVMEIGR